MLYIYTGTTYMWGRYLNYPYKDDFMILEPEGIQKYIEHHHDSAWHGWDAQLIRFFVHYYHILLILLVIFLIIYAILYLYIKTNIPRKFASDLNDNIAKILWSSDQSSTRHKPDQKCFHNWNKHDESYKIISTCL